ncbi:LptA/OstA family protein [Sediminicoccus rosea]|jgi:lipopolysaccharide export system protein LptA|uniref:LptA/OstA family protein n=1 Tax=Sediminicoccus rosea TaxID=1225128 RepID=A0ABZ0PPX3_9PROT|nr:LptA/OstA family protein [Sediminicoccus rosea]WPB87432.1 LptA/OstA family protein [Sediminicoccus rosea]
MRRPLALLGLLIAGPALAQGIDMSQGGPVDITATNGIEWRQAEQVVVARGDARAVRDGTTIEAARLIARYRSQGGAQNAGAQNVGAQPAARPAAAGETPLSGGSEIWRVEAEGDVRIFTPTDTARGDRAVYDMDQAVLVLTGRAISYSTPQQVISARDSLEYWTHRRMAVARGSALVVTQDGRRIAADTLVAHMLEDPPPGATPAGRAVARPGTEGTAGPPPGQGRIDRIELFGNVEIRTEAEVIRGDRAVYSAATGLARVLGNVRITRGENLVSGREAIVNMNTGVSRILSQPGQRVQGIIIPQQGSDPASPGASR